MRVCVSVEARFYATADQRVWCDNQFNFPYQFWQRYLAVFDRVTVVARVKLVSEALPHWKEVTGPQVEVFQLPYYVGMGQFLRNYFLVRKRLREVVDPQSAYILRVASQLGDMLAGFLRSRSIPYGVEVVGDPWEVFGPGVFKHPLRPLLRLWFTWKLKRLCAGAGASSYVTSQALQTRYPSPNATVSISASSIDLKDEAIAAAPRTYPAGKRIIFVGTMEVHQKGVDVLLRAMVSIPEATLTLLGDGRIRPELEALARALGVASRVRFLGALAAGEAVRRELDGADIFVLPSRGEGLSRAMIEAMARGMFCIGTRIGGIQELLPAQWCVPVNDDLALAQAIHHAFREPALMTLQARLNWQKAQEFHHAILSERRGRFYTALKHR